MRRQLGRVDDGAALDNVATDATAAKNALRGVGTEAEEARRKIERLDDSAALKNLKADAVAADRAIDGISQHRQQLGVGGGGIRIDPAARRSVGREAVHAAYDQAGLDSFAYFGGGTGTLLGTAGAAGILGGVHAFKDYAGFDREMRLLGNAAQVPQPTVEQGIKELRALAMDIGSPVKGIFEGFKAQVEASGDWSGSLAMMPDIAKTAKTSGAAPKNVGDTFRAAMLSMGIPLDQLSLASDVMIEGGNAGSFGFREMSAYLPQLLSLAGSKGYQGVSGLASIVASLQAIALRSGGSENAQRQLGEVLTKMDSDEVVNNLEDFGIKDWRSRLKAARESGQDPVNAVLDIIAEATKGDDNAISQIFREKDSMFGVLNLKQARGERNRWAEQFQAAEGATDRDFARVDDDPQTGVDRMGNAAEDIWSQVGKLMARLGLGKAGSGLARYIESLGESPQALLLGPTLSGLFQPQDAAQRTGRMPIGAPAREAEESSMRELRRAIGNGDIEDALSRDHSSAASEAMGGYQATMQAELEETVGMVQTEVRKMRSMLNFSAGPTIRPTFAQAGGAQSGSGLPPAAGDGKRAALAPAKPVSVTQHISAPNSRVAARAAQREQNRAIRLAQWNALGDMGLA